MKGRMVSFMKKWWMIAVVFALALSLTSCARRPGSLVNYGLNYCDGTMGQIDVYTVAVQGQPGTYKIILIPVALDQQGDVVSVTVVNQTTLSYKQIVEQVVLYNDQQVNAGYISEDELNTYDLIAITTFTPGVDFLAANPAKDAICGLPLIGDGI